MLLFIHSCLMHTLLVVFLMRVPLIMRSFTFSVLVLCTLSIASFTEASEIRNGFTIDLIHRDSPMSPFYDPSLTPSQRIKNAALRSIARSNRFSALSINKNEAPRTVTTPDPNTGEYLMRIYIGTPAVERFAIADTGSDLTWVQCTPCKKCTPQTTPLFDPKKSSTFKGVSCDSQPCTLLDIGQRACGKSGECMFRYGYGDDNSVYTIGNLGIESFNFGSKGGGKGFKFPKLTFGCAFINNDEDDMKTRGRNTGLVGLGAGPLSLVSQLGDDTGNKFSYCFLPFGANSTSKLKFGKDAIIKEKRVVSTPLIIKSSTPTFYYLNLEGISYAKKMVKTNRSLTPGNMIIDSGTSRTILRQSFYNKFVALLTKLYGVKPVKNPPQGNKLCFPSKIEDNQCSDGFLDFVFHFTGAKVKVSPLNLVYCYPDDKVFCVGIESTPDNGLSVFGNEAQVGFQVEYDLKGEKVSFARADCTKH